LIFSRKVVVATSAISIFFGAPAGALPPVCAATASSLTPAGWNPETRTSRNAPASGFKLVREIPLPGAASRFDYQSVDPGSGRIYMNHMNAGSMIVFDADKEKVIAEIPNLPYATGVLAVPSRHTVFVSAAGAHQVAIVDDRTLRIVSHVDGIRFPDGIAFANDADKVFVSDESGSAVVAIDAKKGVKRSTIALGGEAGNTHYDSVSHCILVAVQTMNQLVAIDPLSDRVLHRYALPGSDHPHGFAIDEADRLAFISSEGNATLLVVDLRTMKSLQRLTVAHDPDVVAWDADWRRLYVATESGTLNTFWLDGVTLKPTGDLHMPHAHTVAVDPRTHLVYLPLENIAGRPLLRVFRPFSPGSDTNSH
jgi:streptogramin lyase